MAWLYLAALVAVTTHEKTPSLPDVSQNHETKPPIDYNSPVPPQTAFDNSAVEADKTPEFSLLGQLVRTCLALLFVVGLIYGFAKIGLPKFTRILGRDGRNIKIQERVQIDNKHALVLVQVGKHAPLLLATGQQGVQLLTALDPQDLATPLATPFETHLAETQKPTGQAHG